MVKLAKSAFAWTTLLNSDFSFGFKNLGEYNQWEEKANVCISHNGNMDYINFADLLFASFKPNEFFIQSPDGNIVCLQWMFHKIHGHIVPMIINLSERTYHLVDPTRTLWGKELWFVDGILCAKFTETFWEQTKLQQKIVNMKFLNIFRPLQEFFDLNIMDLKVKIVNWENGIQTFRIG
jgi:hypothetical protein